MKNIIYIPLSLLVSCYNNNENTTHKKANHPNIYLCKDNSIKKQREGVVVSLCSIKGNKLRLGVENFLDKDILVNTPRWRELVARAYYNKSLGNVGNISDGLLKFQQLANHHNTKELLCYFPLPIIEKRVFQASL